MNDLNTTLRQFFSPGRTVYNAAAPGRLDVMGGIADYSGSLVLQMPVRERATAWVGLRNDGQIRVRSLEIGFLGSRNEIILPLQELFSADGSIDYPNVRKKIREFSGAEWSAYAIGCILVLMKEKEVSISGADILVQSNVPIGKGVSSSAAIEVAVMSALAKAVEVNLSPQELPTLAQKVENRVVGAPCGIMDQLASYLGEENRLLPILCQPAHTYTPITIPEPIRFLGIDSGVRHAVSGASYGDVRTAAFMGYSIIAQIEGTSPDALLSAKSSGNFSLLPFRGYLANMDVSPFETRFMKLLPLRITGKEFLNQYGEIIDSVTSIDPDKTYAVQTCTAHPVYENHRVQSFVHLLQTLNEQSLPPNERKKILRMLGELMYQSHSSYSACGLGCSGTDELAKAVCDAGENSGVYGAKITGGGSGGTVCVLCDGEKGVQTAQKIAERYSERHDFYPILFDESGPGSRCIGVSTFMTD